MKLSMLWPPHWLRLFSRTSDFTANPVLGSTKLNAMGLHVWRKRLAHAVCEWRRKRLRAGLPEGAADQLSRQGFVQLDHFLTEADYVAVKTELAAAALPVIEMAQPPALTRRINLDVESCEGRYPALHRLITNRALLGLLQYSAGYPGAPIIAVQCIHSGANTAAQGHDPQTDWHSDTFHSTSKAWLYLHDVAADDGPTAYVPASHTPTPARMDWEKQQSVGATSHANRLHAKGSFRVSSQELQQMGYGAPYIAAVKGNTLVVADTSGFHRRSPSPRPTVRVEIYLSLRRNPFFAGLYPGLLALPVIRKRWAGWAFQWYEMLLRQGRPDWIPAPRRGLNGEEIRMLR